MQQFSKKKKEEKKEDERDDTPRGLGLQTKGLGFEAKKKRKRTLDFVERTNALFIIVFIINRKSA